MIKDAYDFGELIIFIHGEWQGHAGVVSWPIQREEAGYVLVEVGTWIAGCRAAVEDVVPADATTLGSTQLAARLLNLSSLLIERRILPLTR